MPPDALHPLLHVPLESPFELQVVTSHREALALEEGHPSRQASLLRPPGAVDLRVADHRVLVEAGVQVEGDVNPRAQVDEEPGGRATPMDSLPRGRGVARMPLGCLFSPGALAYL